DLGRPGSFLLHRIAPPQRLLPTELIASTANHLVGTLFPTKVGLMGELLLEAEVTEAAAEPARPDVGGGEVGRVLPCPAPGAVPEAGFLQQRRAGSGGRRLYAALDLGTNNCRLLIAAPAENGFHVVDAFSRIVRLG